MRVIPPIKRRKSSADGSARIGIGLRGRIKVDICQPNRFNKKNPKVIKRYDWQCNLILDCGLDHCFSYVFANCFTHGHLSTDTATPATTDTTMSGWVKESSSYGSGDGSTSWSGDVYTLQRSFVFSEETGDQTYTKFYSSPESGSDAVPFNELLLGLPITVSSGQQAKITMALDLTITPHMTAKTYTSEVISTSADGSTKLAGSTGKFGIISYFAYDDFLALSGIASDGSTGSVGTLGIASGYYVGLFEPSTMDRSTGMYNTSYQGMGIYTDWDTQYTPLDGDAQIPSSHTASDGISVPSSLSTYVAGSFTRTKTWVAGLNDCNASGIESIGLYGGGSSRPCAQFLLDTPFPKTNLQQFTFNLVFTLSRS